MSLSVFAVAVHAAESVEKCTTGSVATAAVIITLSVWRIIVFRPRNMTRYRPSLAPKSSYDKSSKLASTRVNASELAPRSDLVFPNPKSTLSSYVKIPGRLNLQHRAVVVVTSAAPLLLRSRTSGQLRGTTAARVLEG